MRVPPVTTTLLLGLFAACSHHDDGKPPPDATKPGAHLLEWDFGIVPHGERRTHEFELDLAALPGQFVPLHVALDCSCGHADVRLRKADGSERFVDGAPTTANLPLADEHALLHVEVDTARREAVDLPHTETKGSITLQALDDRTGEFRIRWPFVLRFGVDAPVVLQPFAALDFGRVPASTPHAEVLTALAGDEHHAGIAFANARSDDPDLEVALEPGDGHTVLRARCQPGELGNHRATVTIDTDWNGYRVVLPATWKVVPDLEATPLDKISFAAVFDRAQDDDARQRQFVLLTDHDRRRSPEFRVHRVVDAAGADAAAHFAITIEPVPGQDRQQRMFVRYLGGLADTFRGQIVLTKDGSDGPFLPIELVVFAQKHP